MKRLDATRDPLLSLSGKVKRDGGRKGGDGNERLRAREREREEGWKGKGICTAAGWQLWSNYVTLLQRGDRGEIRRLLI